MSRPTITGVLLLGSVLSACTEPTAEPADIVDGDTVVVTEVVKGDELVVDEAGRSARLRLLGLHAFDEVMEDATLARVAKASVDYLNREVVSKTVTVRLTDKVQDRYGRYLAYVEVEGRDLARSLIEGGVSMVYTEYAFDRLSSYLAVEASARSAGIGLWGDAKLVKMATGLRRQWVEARGGGGLQDPLLALPAAQPQEESSAAPTELPAAADPAGVSK